MSVAQDLATQEAIEFCYKQGWTDGLPVVPCTASMLEAFLETTARARDDVVLAMPHLGAECTVELAAVNAAMAGCLPEYFPVVLAAWDSLAREGYSGGIVQSTTGTAPLLVVNGPVADRIGMNSRGDVFGSGFRANATIARAVRLAILNVFAVRPHALDQSTQGTPAKYGCCIAENEAESPWAPLHVEYGFRPEDSTVTAMTLRSVIHCEARHTVRAEQLLDDFCATMARPGSLMFRTNSTCLVMGPEHAHLLASQGWKRPEIQEYVYAHATISKDDLRRLGKDGISRAQHWRLPREHPDAIDDELIEAEGGLHVLTTPAALQVIVSGARNAGISAICDIFDLKASLPSVALVEADSLTADRESAPREAGLQRVAELLKQDGFGAEWRIVAHAGVEFTVSEGTADCVDCLAPEPLLRSMLEDTLAHTGLYLQSLVLPTFGQERGTGDSRTGS